MYGISLLQIDVAGKSSCILCHSTIIYGERGINAIKNHVETKGHHSKLFDSHGVHLLPGQSDPMNANYGFSLVFGLSTQTVPTKPADDIRPMVHIIDRVGNKRQCWLR